MAVQESEIQILSTRLEFKINKFYEIPMLVETTNGSEFFFGNDQIFFFSVFKNRTDDVQFYITSLSPITPGVLINCLISFVDRHGQERLTERKVVRFKQDGRRESIKQLDFEKEGKDLLVKDALIVRCTFTADYENAMQTETLLAGLSSDFTAMMNNDIFSDVVLKVGKESIPAHKVILAARSKVFAAIFVHMEENRSDCVFIKDIKPLIIKILLHFVYSGVFLEVCTESLYELYAAADKYVVLELKEECVMRILNNLSEDNAISYLLVADRHADKVLKEGVINFLRSQSYDIFLSDQWKEFYKDNAALAAETFRDFINFKLLIQAEALQINS